MLQSSPTILIAFSRPYIYLLLSRFGSFCHNSQHSIGSYWHCSYTKLYKCTPTATKHALHANFTYVHEKVILRGRNRLRALVVLLFGHDMQIQVAHALCKHGCRLISHTANKRRASKSPDLAGDLPIFDQIMKISRSPALE